MFRPHHELNSGVSSLQNSDRHGGTIIEDFQGLVVAAMDHWLAVNCSFFSIPFM